MKVMSISEKFSFSIIIPVYNVEAYVRKCLLSVEEQNFKDFEVIIVNDGSKDRSLKIIKDFLLGCSFEYQLIDQENRGLSVARNVGLSKSSGTYILFLDSDDFLEADTLLYLHNLLTSTRSVDYITFNRQYVDEHYRKIDGSFINYNFDEDLKIIRGNEIVNNLLQFQNISFTVIDKVYSRLFLEEYSPEVFKPNINFEDHIFTFRSSAHVQSVIVSKRRLLNYMVRSTSIMRTANLNMVGSYSIMLKDFIDSIEVYKHRITDQNLIYQHIIVQVASFYRSLYEIKGLSSKDYNQLSKAFKRAINKIGILNFPKSKITQSKKLIFYYVQSPLVHHSILNKIFFRLLIIFRKG